MAVDPGAGTGVEVVSDQLRRHARTLDDLSGHEERVRNAAEHVTLDADAYGQMCQFMPTLFRPLQETIVKAVKQTTTSLSATAAALRHAADEYDLTDKAAADSRQTPR
ncbi:type VII secretion target [Catellatospora paridis]|uniref:type VII secretion target n=1 Tax=Catellatospora paridis TaxID=1617086 RepID=UPI0012D45FC7|nr:type VII secretion target [Catellatospora paridis]